MGHDIGDMTTPYYYPQTCLWSTQFGCSIVTSDNLRFAAGYFAEIFGSMFPPFPEPGFIPDFTGYDLDQQGIEWYDMYNQLSQTPQEALIMVLDYEQQSVYYRSKVITQRL